MKIIFYCKIKQYLEGVAAIEEHKPAGERRKVPTMKDISDDAGLYYTTVNRIVNNKGKRFDYEVMGKIAVALHKRGFYVTESDIIGMEVIKEV